MRSDAYKPDILRFLASSPRFNFQESSSYLIKGICPGCGSKSLFISKEKPFVLCCNHKNACGYESPVREECPEIFEDFAKKYPATPQDRQRTADAYLGLDRGFDISRMRGWYEQGSYPLGEGRDVPTVRFYLDAKKTRWWERIIGKGRDGNKAHFGGTKKTDGTLYKGEVWLPQNIKIEKGDEVFLVEGIFHSIALFHSDTKAGATFSCNHFPEDFIKHHAKKEIRWVLALDSDKAGKPYMRKHYKTLKAMGEMASVCLVPAGKDWDDLYREGKITPENIARWKYNGRLFLAETVEEKAYHKYSKNFRTGFILDFENALYDIKIPKDFLESFEALVEAERDSMYRADKKAKEEGKDERRTEEKDPRYMALMSKEGRELFRQHVQIMQISNVYPQFLYISQLELIDEQRYVFSIDYANGQGQDIIDLKGTDITTPDSFHKALLNVSRGGTFDGETRHLKTLRAGWLNSRMLTVSAVPYVGYEKSVGAYLFQKHAWHNGRCLEVNPQGYFSISKRGIKSSLQGLSINTSGNFSPDWIENYARAFSMQGLVVLAFWLGSLFVQQIREMQKSFPFLEFTGEPGAGKSTVLEFCWKLYGRDDYEGFDLLKSSTAGRRRAFSQVSNLPVVIIESDRDTGEKDARQKQFGFDEVKPFFNGRGTGTLGVAKRGNETDESIFQGSLVISQNAEVDGSQALLERIVHCHADKGHHKAGTREIARWFERQTSDTVGGFLGAALSREREILEEYARAYAEHEKSFTECGLKNERIIKNHSQAAACGNALRILFPKITDKTLAAMFAYLKERAFLREARIRADHPVLEAFWDVYEYINSRPQSAYTEPLNHATDIEKSIAINLNHFREKCTDHGQGFPDLGQLKKLLPHTKRYPFVDTKAIRSRLDNKNVWCWVFEKGGR